MIGRSVFSRNVRQGIPSTVVSSCIPPESVNNQPRVAVKRKKIEVAQRLDQPQVLHSHPRDAKPIPRSSFVFGDEREKLRATLAVIFSSAIGFSQSVSGYRHLMDGATSSLRNRR